MFLGVEVNKLSKKELKNYINERGGFHQLMINAVDKEPPAKYKNDIPEGAIYFEGVASTGELNRNGYIIREKAWKEAGESYMENPVILLQHEAKEVCGKCLWYQVSKEGLKVGGYIYDDLTEGRFGRGLLRALSTGHITEEVEFENEETGQVLSEEEFRKLSYEERYENNTWILCVTKLDWVEFSLVAIGSNRKSLIKSNQAIMNYLKEKVEKNNNDEEKETKNPASSENGEEKAESAPDAGENPDEKSSAAEGEKAEGGEGSTEEKAGESPESTDGEESTTEGGEEADADVEGENSAKAPQADFVKLMNDIASHINSQNEVIEELKKEVNQLKSAPNRKGILYHSNGAEEVDKEESKKETKTNSNKVGVLGNMIQKAVGK